jgi:Domain of unknown function (DUF4168)
MTFLPFKAAVTAALAVVVLSLPAARSVADEPMPSASVPKAKISEKRLNDFVAAAKDVYAIRQKYAPKFKDAKDDGEKQQVLQTARGEMKSAIENRGMTVEQYNDVLVAAKGDQELAERIGKMLDDATSQKGG